MFNQPLILCSVTVRDELPCVVLTIPGTIRLSYFLYTGGRDKVKWFRFKKWYIYSRWKVLLWCANDSLVLNLNFATVRPKKGGKSTTNGQKYWKFYWFHILKILVKIMDFQGQKLAFSKHEFLPHDKRSLWLYRSTLFEAPNHIKLCGSVL